MVLITSKEDMQGILKPQLQNRFRVTLSNGNVGDNDIFRNQVKSIEVSYTGRYMLLSIEQNTESNDIYYIIDDMTKYPRDIILDTMDGNANILMSTLFTNCSISGHKFNLSYALCKTMDHELDLYFDSYKFLSPIK